MSGRFDRPAAGWTELVTATIERLGGLPTEDVEGAHRAVAGVERWLDLVLEWNARIDLTAARSADELVDLFVADAVVIARGARRLALAGDWLDVGTGAGAPAVALSLFGVPLRTLVEPSSRRVAFLRTVVGTLALPVEVVRARSEALDARSCDVAISRATLQPPEWVTEGTRLARRAAWVTLGKKDAPSPPAKWRVALDETYEWPGTGASRRIVCLVH